MLAWLVTAAAITALPIAGEPDPLTRVEDAYPSLSPDGSRLLFQSTRGGRWALYTAEPTGTNIKLFLDSGDDPVVAVWSPDGRRIAFAATVEEQSEIFVIGADGRGRRRLTSDPGDDSHPHWSADGNRIFFNSARSTPDRSAPWPRQWHEIYSMKPDGSDPRKHTNCRTVCTYPVSSPDGRRLAYRKIIDAPGLDWSLKSIARNSEVFVADMNGANELNLTRHAAYDGYPMWSPDGQWIVFCSARTGYPNGGQLFAIKPDGSSLRQITDSAASYVQPSFTPDGTSVYASRVYEPLDFSWTYSHLVLVPVAELLDKD
ncbi:MAG: TolB family protein [Gammaproteobacteria bacterium]